MKQAADKVSHNQQLSTPPEPHKSGVGRIVTLIFLCFVASFLGSWVFLRTGLVKQDASQTIENNRQSIVVQEGAALADATRKASPSVVSIVASSVSNSDSLFGASVEQGAGTGVIISKNGYVLTNKHVIGEGAANIHIVTADGTEYKNIRIIGRDPLNDLAFLKIEGAKSLPAAEMADSDKVNIGEKVIAIGNALGQYQNSVTAGIISGIGRPIVAQGGSGNSEQLENLFQTDAAINPGNSGGPLVNLQGQVIGINTAVAEDAQGIGFSIPINFAKGDIKSVINTGKLTRSYLGVRYVSITPEVASSLNLDVKQGAYVYDDSGNNPVVDGSPAAKAGLRGKDIITKVNNEAVNSRHGLAGLLAQFPPGEKITLTVIRDGQTRQIDVTLGQYTENDNN